MGSGQGPGGKFAGFLFLIKSINSSIKQIKNKQLLKSRLSYKEYKIMAESMDSKLFWSKLISAGLLWTGCVRERSHALFFFFSEEKKKVHVGLS